MPQVQLLVLQRSCPGTILSSMHMVHPETKMLQSKEVSCPPWPKQRTAYGMPLGLRSLDTSVLFLEQLQERNMTYPMGWPHY